MAPRIALQIMQMMFALIRSLFANKADLALEVLALKETGSGRRGQTLADPHKSPRRRRKDVCHRWEAGISYQLSQRDDRGAES